MPMYNFLVARFVPDLVKNEPVNVGIIVNDKSKKKTHGRFIENFRPLAGRYRNSNINALKEIIDSFRGDLANPSENNLKALSENFHYQLRFTEPRAIKAGSHDAAVASLFDQYISIESKVRKRKAVTKIQLRRMIAKEIEHVKFEKEWIKPRQKIKGRIGHFTFDYGFKNGKIKDLLHSISFAGNEKTAYRDAKALAISFEDALSKYDDLSCTAIIHRPSDEKILRDFYEPAVGYLKDKKCVVKGEDEIHPCLVQIKKKLANR